LCFIDPSTWKFPAFLLFIVTFVTIVGIVAHVKLRLCNSGIISALLLIYLTWRVGKRNRKENQYLIIETNVWIKNLIWDSFYVAENLIYDTKANNLTPQRVSNVKRRLPDVEQKCFMLFIGT